MNVVRKTLQENYIFFIRELGRINDEIRHLPPGSISAKKIGKSTYYYRQWREGKKIKSVSLGADPPPGSLEDISRRKVLEGQRKEALENIRIIAKAIDTQRVTADEILRIFSRNGIRVTLIGSYYLPIIKESLGFNLPTIRTQDIDFLVPVPYRGKKSDIASLLEPIGFSAGFNHDGSTYYTNGIFKVEFLAAEKGRGTRRAVLIKPLNIKATALRYLHMLFDQQVTIKREGYSVKVPNPWAFAYHKILVAKKSSRRQKADKDLLQAHAILREVFSKPDSSVHARKYLETLPKKWKTTIKSHMAEHLPEVL